MTFANPTLLMFHETNPAEESKENRFPMTLDLQSVGIFELKLI